MSDSVSEDPRDAPKENNIIKKILKKAGNPSLLSDLESKLSMSEINSLLLELFKTKTREMKPAELLRQYAQNRFVNPSDIDPVLSYRASADLLEAAGKAGYTALELSPVTVLGACSVIAQVDQNKVLSALSGTEVLSDATNALALHIAHLKNRENLKKSKQPNPERCKPERPKPERLRYCSVHRHIRTQKFQGKNQLSHFTLYGMVISGTDEGNFKFEKEALLETLRFYHDFLQRQSHVSNPRFIIWPRGGYPGNFTKEISAFLRENNFPGISEGKAPSESDYYRGLQFKIKAFARDTEFEVADGGFVDWPRKLLQNNKERMLISGLGLERLIKQKV